MRTSSTSFGLSGDGVARRAVVLHLLLVVLVVRRGEFARTGEILRRIGVGTKFTVRGAARAD